MHPLLAKIFVHRGIIRQGTVLEAYQSARSLSGGSDAFVQTRYVVLSASATDEWVYFITATSPTERHRLRCDFVTSIDGMVIERVASAHQLKLDGSVTAKPKGRRRKKKAMLMLQHEAVEPLPAVTPNYDPAGDSLAHHEG